MKKNLLIGLFCIAAVGLTSCDDKTGTTSDPVPNIQFATSSYALDDQPVELKIVSSFAPASDLTVGFTLGGTATADDYDLSATEFTLKAGETEATVTVTPKKVYPDEKTLSLTLQKGDGFDIGRLGSSSVTMKSIMYTYSFSAAQSELLESVEIKLTVNDDDFKAPNDVSIPFTILEGTTSVVGEHYNIKDDATHFVIPKGGNTAKITLLAGVNADMLNPTILKIGIDTEKNDGRFIAGQIASATVAVKGILSFAVLSGQWVCRELIELEYIELFAMEDELDTDLIPSHNDGYTIEFKYEDGIGKFIPGSNPGDLSHLFRECEISYTAPVNLALATVITGQYTTNEAYFWTSERMNMTYFELSSVNRSFDNTNEKLGKAPIALRVRDDGNLELHLKEYDKPPFLETWWNDENFDSETLGFAYIFERVVE